MVKYLKLEKMCIDAICTCAPAERKVAWLFSEQRLIDWLDELLKLDELIIKAMERCVSCKRGYLQNCVCAREYFILEARLSEAERPHPHLPTFEEKEEALRDLDEETDKCPLCAANKCCKLIK